MHVHQTDDSKNLNPKKKNINFSLIEQLSKENQKLKDKINELNS